MVFSVKGFGEILILSSCSSLIFEGCCVMVTIKLIVSPTQPLASVSITYILPCPTVAQSTSTVFVP